MLDRISTVLPICLGLALLPSLTADAGGQVEPALAKKAAVDDYGDPLPPGAVARIGTVKFRQGGGSVYLDLTRDAKILAAGGVDDTLSLWDVATGKELNRFVAGADVWAVRIAPDGKWVAFLNGGMPHVLDAATGKVLYSAKEMSAFQYLALSQDGRRLAGIGSFNHLGTTVRTFALWDTANWAELRYLKKGVPSVHSLAISPDGKQVALGLEKEVAIYDLPDFQLKQTWKGLAGIVDSVAFAPDGKRLAAGCATGDLYLRDLAAPHTTEQWKGHKQYARYLAFTPDGDRLLSQSESFKLWDLKEKKVVTEVPAAFGVHEPAVLSADGKLLVAGLMPLFWELPSGKQTPQPPAAGGVVAFAADGKTLVTGGRTISLWDVAAAKVRKVVSLGDVPGLHPAVVSPDGKTLGQLVSYGGGVDLWDLEAGKKFGHEPPNPPNPPIPLAQFPYPFFTGNRALFLMKGDSLILQDLKTKKALHQCPKPKLPGKHAGTSFNRMLFAPDLRLLAVGPGLSLIHTSSFAAGPTGFFIWDSPTDKMLHHLKEANDLSPALAFSADGRFLATGGGDLSTVLVWDMASGQVAARLTFAGGGEPAAVAFAPDGRTLACADRKSAVRLFDLAAGTPRHVFQSHRGWSTALDFSPDGTLLASANSDFTTLVWAVPQRPVNEPAKLSAAELDSLLDALAGPDAIKAYQAAWKLADAGGQPVPALEKRLLAAVPDKKQLQDLIAELDSEAYKVRTKAVLQLVGLGELAEPALKETLKKKISVEMHLRVEQVLKQLDPLSPPQIFRKRAVMVLEHCGSPEAVRVLQTLAKEMPHTTPGQQAQAALQRLQKKQPPS